MEKQHHESMSLTDQLIHDCLINIEESSKEIKPYLSEFIHDNYHKIHQLTKDTYFKDLSSIDIWDLTVYSLFGIMIESYLYGLNIDYRLSKWDIINASESETLSFEDMFQHFKRHLINKEDNTQIINLINNFEI